jgi:Ca2+/Na+ antiporter
VPHLVQRLQDLGVADWGQLGSTVISGLLVAAGVAGLARSRRFAYRMFKRSVLVTIFITQVFMFYDEQLSAIVGLAINGLLLLALQAAIDFDQQRAEEPATEADGLRGKGTGVVQAPCSGSPELER